MTAKKRAPKPPPAYIDKRCGVCGAKHRRRNGLRLRWMRERGGESIAFAGRWFAIGAAYLSDIERNLRPVPDRIWRGYSGRYGRG